MASTLDHKHALRTELVDVQRELLETLDQVGAGDWLTRDIRAALARAVRN